MYHPYHHFRILSALPALTLWEETRKSYFSRIPPQASDADDVMLIKDGYRTVRKHYTPPKYPVVLCHGLSGFDTITLLQLPQIAASQTTKEISTDLEKVSRETSSSIMLNYWHGIEDALTKVGAKVITARVPPFGTIRERAESLDALLQEKLKEFPRKNGGERIKINLVGHSMGGLDARYLTSKIQNSTSPYKVVSVTTISTPHHGSEVADFVMSFVENGQVLQGICPKAIPQLTTDYMRKFNQSVKDDPSVGYFSYGASMHPDGFKLFRATYEIMKREMKKKGTRHLENDGMVSVKSSKWGKYVGTLDDVDHLDLINWTNRVKIVVDQAMFQKSPTFDPIALYLDIAEMLSKHGY